MLISVLVRTSQNSLTGNHVRSFESMKSTLIFYSKRSIVINSAAKLFSLDIIQDISRPHVHSKKCIPYELNTCTCLATYQNNGITWSMPLDNISRGLP